jgi:hypothetical protein
MIDYAPDHAMQRWSRNACEMMMSVRFEGEREHDEVIAKSAVRRRSMGLAGEGL